MGGACCKQAEPELNPDGTEKQPQTEEQAKQDPIDLRRAAKDGDLVVLEQLLQRMPKSQINSGASKTEGPAEEVGNTALHFSAQLNHVKAVKMLLLYAANPSKPNSVKKTPLHLAVEGGKRGVAEILFAEADPNAQDDGGVTPLLSVMLVGRKKYTVWVLTQFGPRLDLDIKDKEGNTPATLAAKYGWWDVLQSVADKLKAPEKTLNIRNSSGETPLTWVLKFGSCPDKLPPQELLRLVTLLLVKGASASVPGFEEKVPPLALAAASCNKEVFLAVLQRVDTGQPASLQVKDALGRTPLHYAAAKGAVPIADELMSRGLKPYDLDKSSNTPLHLAGMRGQGEVSELLISKADDVSLALLTPNKDGLTAYHLALKAGPTPQAQSAALQVLSKVGEAGMGTAVMDKKARDTPLLLAIGAHADLVVAELIKKGQDVNAPNLQGETPLARNLASVTDATFEQDAAIFDALLAAGASTEPPPPPPGAAADPNAAKVAEYNHPLLAICKNNVSRFAQRAVGVLSARGQLKWERQDEEGRTPLMLAALHDNAWLVRHLLEAEGQDVNARDAGGMTPLMYAASGASVAAVKALLNRGANPNATDSSGRTPLCHCLRTDRSAVLQCAAALLVMGAKPVDSLDITGEGLLHRAVRWGADKFVDLWARHGGNLALRCTLPDGADDMAGDELIAVQEEGGDVMDAEPEVMEEEEEEVEEEEGAEGPEAAALESKGSESGAALPSPDGPRSAPEPIAEGVEGELLGRYESFHPGPSMRKIRAVTKQGARWFDSFWGDVRCADQGGVDEDDDVELMELYTDLDEGEGHVDVYDVLWQMRVASKAAQQSGRAKSARGPVAEGRVRCLSADDDEQLVASLLTTKGYAYDPLIGEAVSVREVEGDAPASLSSTSSWWGSGPVAEALNQVAPEPAPPAAEAPKRSIMGSADAGMTSLKAKGLSALSSMLDKKFAVTDPYYLEESLYQGLPRYMDESVVKIDKIPLAQLDEWANSIHSRLAAYKDLGELPLAGPDLRERNIQWWNRSLPPQEYPLKVGQWRSQAKKGKKAVEVARKRRPAAPGKKPRGTRKKTAWFGLPDMPDRPELNETSALVYAVRLGRVNCVRVLLGHSLGLLNDTDGWGLPPISYAMYMLAKDRNSAAMSHIVDLLLLNLPLVNMTSLDAPSVMSPLVGATLLADVQRMAWLIRRCCASINNAWVYLPDIPAYFCGIWEKQAAKCLSRVNPLHLAVLHRRFELVKALLDLGANPNSYGQPLDAAKIREKLRKEKEEENAQIMRMAEEINANGGKLTFKTRAKVSLMHKMKKMKKAIMAIEIPGLSKPHPWITPLHLCGRYGLPEIAFLLVKRGAMVNGAGAATFAKKTPLQEALTYARSNFLVANSEAVRNNWGKVREHATDFPAMHPVAAAKEANAQASKIMSMLDPTTAAIKAVALAAKAVVLIFLEMRKRPIAHYDPAMACAHVLLMCRSPINPADTQTQIMLRDLMDNSSWMWLTENPRDEHWTQKAITEVNELKQHEDFGYQAMSSAQDPKDYKDLKKQFQAAVDLVYYTTGGKAHHELHRPNFLKSISDARDYMQGEFVKLANTLVSSAALEYVNWVEKQLEDRAAARAAAIKEAADALEGGQELVEEEPGAEGMASLPARLPSLDRAPSLAGASEALRSGASTSGAPASALLSRASMRAPNSIAGTKSMRVSNSLMGGTGTASAMRVLFLAQPFVLPDVRKPDGQLPAALAKVQTDAAATLRELAVAAGDSERGGFWPTAAAAAAASALANAVDLGGTCSTNMFRTPKEGDAFREAVVNFNDDDVKEMGEPVDTNEKVDEFTGTLGDVQEHAEGLLEMVQYVGVELFG